MSERETARDNERQRQPRDRDRQRDKERLMRQSRNSYRQRERDERDRGYERILTFWFDRESIISGILGFAISVCRLRERGRMSKSVYVRVFHDLELLRYVLSCAIGRQL